MRAHTYYEPYEFQPGAPARVVTVPHAADLENLIQDVKQARQTPILFSCRCIGACIILHAHAIISPWLHMPQSMPEPTLSSDIIRIGRRVSRSTKVV